MGAYTCEFGVVHKRCRCPQPHTIRCDVPGEHNTARPPRRPEGIPAEGAPVWKRNDRKDHDAGHPSGYDCDGYALSGSESCAMRYDRFVVGQFVKSRSTGLPYRFREYSDPTLDGREVVLLEFVGHGEQTTYTFPALAEDFVDWSE